MPPDVLAVGLSARYSNKGYLEKYCLLGLFVFVGSWCGVAWFLVVPSIVFVIFLVLLSKVGYKSPINAGDLNIHPSIILGGKLCSHENVGPICRRTFCHFLVWQIGPQNIRPGQIGP